MIFLFSIILFLNFNDCDRIPSQEKIQSYMVWVDNLRLRAEPDLKSAIMNHLPVGAVVEWSGIESKTKQEIELRGEVYNEPFYYVTDHQGNKGWLYAGAIYRISNNQLDKLEKEKIGLFSQFLNNDLNVGIDAGGKSLNYYFSHFGNQDSNLKTAATVILIKYLQSLEIELWDALESIEWPDNEDVGHYVNKDIPIFNRLRNSGFKICASEGMYFPEVDWDALVDEAGSNIDQSLSEFLQLKALDQQNVTESDGAIIVPIEFLGDRAIRWEQFNYNHPYFVMQDQSTREEDRYKLLVLTGMDNTPAMDWEDKVNNNFRDGWRIIVNQYPNTSFSNLLEQYMKVLENNNWYNSEKAKVILSKLF